ncbi:MAG: hypothetical protein VX278_13050 [Myxococcota bacterium]|nr:hypothetical protein [Myxococcota bacterium]
MTSSGNHTIRMGLGACLLLCSMLVLWKPVHIDEANFLSLAQGSFLAPHNVAINWQGTTERAFDVLSNPPGIAWYLYPVRDGSRFLLRAWMLPWSFLALWGFWILGRLYGQRYAFAAFAASSPVFALSHGALLPDMPLLACTVLGYAVFLSHKRYFWGAFLIGLGFWFRYSALVPVVTLVLWALLQPVDIRFNVKIWMKILCGILIAPALLLIHDIWAYNSFHFWQMISFQGLPKTGLQQLHQLLAIFAQGASGVFLCVGWLALRKERRVWLLLIFAIVAVGLSLSLWNAFWIAVGFACLSTLPKTNTLRWAGLSLCGGIVFLFLLRFTATRYWIPFLPLLVIYFKPFLLNRYMPFFFVASGLLSTFLCLDDWEFARGYQKIATDIQTEELTGRRGLAGHWGLQWHLEQQGFVPLEDDQPLNHDHVVHSQSAWPQEASGGILKRMRLWEHRNQIWGPSVYSEETQSHFHANMIAPDVQTYASWGWYGSRFDTVTLWKRCAADCTGCIWNVEQTPPACTP